MQSSEKSPNGTIKEIDGKSCIYYDGYWIKYYVPMEDSLATKKKLIEALTRRLFNHVEHGINMPGDRLDEARKAYSEENDEALKRVKGAMLAGALFNRGTDIFRELVKLDDESIKCGRGREMLHECGQYLLESLELGGYVKHRSGEEGIDELWGEPFRAFTVPIESFYETRYIKISQSMHDIDRISGAMIEAFQNSHFFQGVEHLTKQFADAAKLKSETLRTDPVIFDVWPKFAVAGEKLLKIGPLEKKQDSCLACWEADEGHRLIKDGADLITHIARARVSMPKSANAYIDRCHSYLACRGTVPGLSRVELKSL
ncbi:MAG: hypothetical protein AAES65_05330 [Candidatus Thiodiazotropha sp. (ex. Lucinoma kazani)]|nr:hypothetical protein [Candidatus Thiodiazotropha sp. (ex Lucinoma borealis)]MCU7857365.1 hypothetical protein [Candidatus Thiodiazotropha sp. (ex Lucinoma borealis)]MCU7867935.1 hypothetical protein [Candidatus Thiodiazotropha sp. (ex Lucinoma borealis)]MCU7876120.1 hypothetical protein [Candidatus Thiodiazotropha sp. (ex Lucinoma borealis)]